MSKSSESPLVALLKDHEQDLLEQWLKAQLSSELLRSDLVSTEDLRQQSARFLSLFKAAVVAGKIEDLEDSVWDQVKESATQLSSSRAEQGFSPAETAHFILSLKQPLFESLRTVTEDLESAIHDGWLASNVLDQLSTLAFTAFVKSREEVINRQRQDLAEMATPVVKLWEGVLAVPLIGTLDSARTQQVMETLLQAIVAEDCSVAIIDITGVPTVDTLVAQHLMKTASACRLMGADCIVSGIRPNIAQTIVDLGVELGDIITQATLADAFRRALQMRRTNRNAAREL